MKLRLGLTALLMLAVAGCGLISRRGATGEGVCPAATADTQLLKNEERGYCLLYPADYLAEQPNPDETVFTKDSLQNVEDGRASIQVSDASGRAAPEIASGIVREIAATLPGWGLRQSTLRLDGETAIVLDNVPGHDPSRQVVLVHGGRFYLLTFVPTEPTQSGKYQEMEKIYKTIVESFRFAP
jgi:hypothetical protein